MEKLGFAFSLGIRKESGYLGERDIIVETAKTIYQKKQVP